MESDARDLWGCAGLSAPAPAPGSSNMVMAFGIAFAAGGIYVGETDDAPGAALIGILLLVGSVVLGVRIARRKT